MKRCFTLLLLAFAVSQTTSAQCTFAVPPGTIVVTNDTVINSFDYPNASYYVCKNVTVSDCTWAPALRTYYLDSMARLEFFLSESYGIITAYVKAGATLEAGIGIFIYDTIIFETGAIINAFPSYSNNPGCLEFDLAAIGGNPCGISTSRSTEVKSIFSISPNPANNQFRLQTELSGMVRINDLQGREVYFSPWNPNSPPIDTRGWVPGLYFLVFTSGEKMATQKLIIE
jgi:Secretion system C-terminal sorting domain